MKDNLHLGNSRSLLDYFYLIRNNLIIFIFISSSVLIAATYYAITRIDIYRTTTILKISKPDENILDTPLIPSVGDQKSNRFIANEIETMKNITIREKVAQVIIDSIKAFGQQDKLALIPIDNHIKGKSTEPILNVDRITAILGNIVTIQQKSELDFIEIIVESPSPNEAALIANTYANVYGKFNLLENRESVSRIKDFLEERKEEKYEELLTSENEYKKYQLQGGAIDLTEQATSLIQTISTLESQLQAGEIEMLISKEKLFLYKAQLKKKDITVSKYLNSKINEPYIQKLQEQIAELETQRDYALTNKTLEKNSSGILKEFDNRIDKLKQNLTNSIKEYQTSILAASPEEIRTLTQKIFEEEIKYNSFAASSKNLREYLNKYQKRFDALPERNIDLARLERSRLADEKMFSLIEEKYQEALINEQSTLGNVLVLSYARPPGTPAKPDRQKIILVGLVLGLVLGFSLILIKDSTNKSVNTPEELEDNDIAFLGWIPKIKNIKNRGKKSSELIVANMSNFPLSDAFKSLRTTLRFSKNEIDSKCMLITSPAKEEGKTFIATNLAGSYAQIGKKTLIIDCDLRRPRLHSIFKEKNSPGITDYLASKVKYQDILRKTEIKNLYYISAGSIPPNPTEILDSQKIITFFNYLKELFDKIIIDSPPLSTLADSYILSKLADETILITKAGVTDLNLIIRSIKSLKKIEGSTFSGVVLNQLDLKKQYGSYYNKYSYEYGNNGSSRKLKKKNVN